MNKGTVDKVQLIFKDNPAGVMIYDLTDISMDSKGRSLSINANWDRCTYDTRFINLETLYDSVVHNVDIAQQEMLLNLKYQGYIQ